MACLSHMRATRIIRFFSISGHHFGLAARLQRALLVKAPELDAGALLERIANTIGDCLAIGTLNRKTGALGAYLPRSEHWAALLRVAATDAGSVFPGARLGAVAALLTRVAEGQESTGKLARVSLVADESLLVFQRCPWDPRQVLFAVLPDNGACEINFACLRLVLESVRRDVAIVRAPRVEERCWN